MSDSSEFLSSYRETLADEISAAGWPPEITALYTFESCLKHEEGKEVYLVTDKRTGGPAILRATAHDNGDQAEAEWEILSRLDHPGIPKTYGKLITPHTGYIVREFVEGRPLDSVIAAQGPLAPADILSVTRKLCDILSYLHKQVPPIIHRDIKPQNIILKPDGSLVLTDFGIARVYKPGANSDTRYVGTLPYAPPEQYGYAQSTPQTDIYALGIVLVYLATGSPDRQNLQEKVRNKKLYNLIRRCIAFDPADRFSSVDEIAASINSRRHFAAKCAAGIGGGAAVLALAGVVLFNVLSLPPETDGAASGGGGTPPADATDNTPQASTSGQNASPAAAYASGDPLFDSDAQGNLSGNLGNGGFAVEGDGVTYVAHSDGVYVLEDDGSLGRKVVDETSVKSLNYYKGRLYFSTSTALMSADPQTGEAAVIRSQYTQDLFLSDDVIYFENGEDGLNLYAVNPDGTDMRKVSDFGSVYYRNVAGGYQYFANTGDGERLYRVNLETGEETKLYNERSAWMSIYGDSIYFSDFTIPGKMMRMDLDGGNAEELFSGSYSYVNATPLGVFFINPEAQQLEVMTLDGSSRTLLTQGKCGAFCVTGQWIVYENNGNENDLWIMRPDGSDNRALPDPDQA